MKSALEAMKQIRDKLVKGDLLCEVVAVSMLDEAIKQVEAQRYPLPDTLYPDSKDWVQGDYAERVEWLHSMYENQKEQTEMYVQMALEVGHGQ